MPGRKRKSSGAEANGNDGASSDDELREAVFDGALVQSDNESDESESQEDLSDDPDSDDAFSDDDSTQSTVSGVGLIPSGNGGGKHQEEALSRYRKSQEIDSTKISAEVLRDGKDKRSPGELLNAKPNYKVTKDANGNARYVYDEIDPVYDSDDSDAPAQANTIGNIPLSFYDSYPHIGYDINGRKIMRPAKGEALDALLETVEVPKGWTGLTDPATGKPLKLSQEELEVLKKIQMNEIPEDGYDPYAVRLRGRSF